MTARFKYLAFAALLIGSAALLIHCGRNNANHAPTCGAGQFLFYDPSSGYHCNYAQVGTSAYTTNPYNGYGAYGSSAAPVPGCPPTINTNEPQILVNWCGTWMCRKQHTIYPDGDSPTGCMAPGEGLEFCTVGSVSQNGLGGIPPYVSGSGTPFQQPYSGYGTYGSSYGVSCSASFQCVPEQAIAPNYLQQSQYLSGGQAGLCSH